MEKIKKYKWHIFASVLLVLQIISGVVAVIELVMLNMFPDDIVALLIGCLGVLLLINTLLMLPKAKMRKDGTTNKLVYVRRSVGAVTTIAVIIAGSMAAFYVGHLNHTVSTISTDAKASNMIAVYVREDDPAKELADTKSYLYGITEQYDYENTEQTLDHIAEEFGQQAVLERYESVNDMVDALYREEVDAIILNKAYVDILTDQDKYAGFEEQCRIVYEYQIVEEEEPETEESTEPETEQEVKEITNSPFIVYVSGSDTRSLSLQTSRSDVNLLVVVNPVTKQVLLVNTPRDYYIDTAKAPGQYDKLTHCGMYGIDCSMRTLTNLYQENVDYYMQINFEGFREFTTAIGGVSVYNEKAFVSYKDNYSYPVGQVLLSGDYALSYVRERKSFADGDNQRGRNQMKVVKAIIAKMKDSNTLLTNYTDILASLEGMFVTDMPADDMAALVKMQLSDMADWNVNSYAVGGTGASKTTYTMPTQRAYVTVPDMATVAKAQELIDKIYAGETLTEADMEIAPADATAVPAQ